jgi:carboxyl-terminal processing protease
MMKTQRIIVLGFFVLLTACGKSPVTLVGPTATSSVSPITPASSMETPSISPEAAKYLNDALDIMQNNSINKDKIDWVTFRARILNNAANSETLEDTYPFIKLALLGLNDHHSSFLDPQEASALQNGTNPTNPTPLPPKIQLMEDKFGYVEVPSYRGLNQDLINQYGTDMQKHIQEVGSQHPCGWVVDLRANRGGNMWPMLIGIGPILGEGAAGSFINADGDQKEWAYVNGKGMEGSQVVGEITGEPYHLAEANTPVAVLFGGTTASSGEIIALSFVGRTNTRSFGSPSAGFTTGNEEFVLSDQAIIFVTTVVDADRTGKVYGGPIVPDVQVSGDTNDTETIPKEALQWLNDQPACN